MTAKRSRATPKPRQRILDAAYDLFCANGINQVGIDTILAESGCAKASLYSNFKSKVALAVAFLDRRETVWTREWLETEIKRRASSPKARLLVVFEFSTAGFARRHSRAVLSSMHCWRRKQTARYAGRLSFISRRSAPLSRTSRRRRTFKSHRSSLKFGIC